MFTACRGFIFLYAVVVAASSDLLAAPLPFPDGRYVTDLQLCAVPEDQLIDRYGDGVAIMVRNISGRKLDNGYEMYCEIVRVSTTKNSVRFEALCEMEGEKVRQQATYTIVSATSFRIGSRTFSLCPTVR